MVSSPPLDQTPRLSQFPIFQTLTHRYIPHEYSRVPNWRWSPPGLHFDWILDEETRGFKKCAISVLLVRSDSHPELGTRSFFPGSLSALLSIFIHGSLLLYSSFCRNLGSLIAQSLSKRPSVRSWKRALKLSTAPEATAICSF